MKKLKSVGGFHSIKYALSMFSKLGFIDLLNSMLRKNTCKTCALGMGGQKGGMTNELGHFPELCKKTLQAMKSDMAGGIDDLFLKTTSIENFAKMSPRELDALGRIPYPLYSKRGDQFYTKISYEEAFQKIITRLKETEPNRSFFYFSGRSSNEAGFLLQLMARVYGTNHVNNCSYYCHQASGVGLSQTIGSGTATVTLEDVENCDLFFLIGGNPTSNHPRLLTTLSNVKLRGGKVIVINPVKEPGLVKFKVPSNPLSLLFGTQIADEYVQPHIGGDLSLLNGMIKALFEMESYDLPCVDHDFIENSTEGFESFKNHIQSLSWKEIVQDSGVSKREIRKIAEIYAKSKNVIFSWTMGITHHLNGVENVQSIVNLALIRGMVGKPYSGLLPLRGHSNVQGMGSMGVTPKLKEKIFQNLTQLGFKLPEMEGYDTMACMDASDRGDIDFAWCLGGNLYGSNPDSVYAGQSMSKIKTLLYLNTTFNQGHFFARGEETIILPVLARDEEAESTTQESMFNFVRLSDGGPKRLANLKSETEIISDIASGFLGEDVIRWKDMKNHKNIRDLISKCIPGMEDMMSLERDKKEFHIPGRILHQGKFPTPSGKAKFTNCSPLEKMRRDNSLTMMSVRSEGQYNTVVYEEEDVFRGISRRDVILMNPNDMERMKLKEDQRVSISSSINSMQNILVKPFDVKEGNALMYFPECNVLISRDLDPQSKTPAYKSTEITINN